MRFFKIIVLSVLLSQCKKKVEVEKPIIPVVPVDQFVVIDYSLETLNTDSSFSLNNSMGGKLNHPALVEASGLAVSRSNPNILWSHNDKGHTNRLYALGNNGENFGYFSVTGAGSRDYEDICIGPGPADGANYLYLGDIGDNDAVYNFIVVYRFPEPDVTQIQNNGMHAIAEEKIERFEFQYPDGPVDSETLMIDPWTKDLYIVTKREFRSIIYKAPFPQTPNTRTTLQKIAQLPFNFAVAGDISSDGTKIAIKDLNRIFCWTRNTSESVLDALKRPPLQLPYSPEPQGESFAWGKEGHSYFTLSEQQGTTPPILFNYQKK